MIVKGSSLERRTPTHSSTAPTLAASTLERALTDWDATYGCRRLRTQVSYALATNV